MKSRANPARGSGLIDLTSDSMEAVNAVNEENVDGGTSDRVWAADSGNLGHITATDVDGGQSDRHGSDVGEGTSDKVLVADIGSLGPITAKDVDGGRVMV